MTEFQKYIQRYLDLIPTENWLEEMKKTGEFPFNEKCIEYYYNIFKKVKKN